MEPLYLILPNIRSCHNVGAMFRTGDAFGVEKIYFAGYTANPPKPQIDKVSLGAEQWIPWERWGDVCAGIRQVQASGVQVFALEKTEKSRPIDTVAIRGPVALVVGEEVNGVSDEILAVVDGVMHIPMYGKKKSLNVSVAAGIAMHTLRAKLEHI